MPGASYLAVTGEARPGRILLAEQQVLSIGPPIAAQLHRRLRVAPERPSSAAGSRGSRLRTRREQVARGRSAAAAGSGRPCGSAVSPDEPMAARGVATNAEHLV